VTGPFIPSKYDAFCEAACIRGGAPGHGRLMEWRTANYSGHTGTKDCFVSSQIPSKAQSQANSFFLLTYYSGLGCMFSKGEAKNKVILLLSVRLGSRLLLAGEGRPALLAI
jgi:hypothetical protein